MGPIKSLGDRAAVRKPGRRAEETYFSGQITKDIIAGASRFGRLPVFGMTWADAFRDRSANFTQVVSELEFDYAVQGRQAGNIVHLSAQLFDARSGLTVWANRYELVVDNLFAA